MACSCSCSSPTIVAARKRTEERPEADASDARLVQRQRIAPLQACPQRLAIQQPQPQKEPHHVRTAIYNFIVRVNRSSGLHLCFVVMHSINCAGMGYTSQGTGGTTPMHARGSDDRDMLNRLQRACAGELRRKSPDQIRAARSIRRNLQLVLVGVATLTNTIAGVWENYLMVRSPFRPDCLCAVRAVRVCDRPTS